MLAVGAAGAASVWTGCNAKAGHDPRAGTTTVLSLAFEGRGRRAIVHVSKRFTGTEAIPVILSFHGWGSGPEEQEALTGLDAVADREGFLAVYPEGTGRMKGFNAGDCCGEPIGEKLDDVGFTRALLDELGKSFPVDAKRVFATGMSNGGFLDHRLACELSDRIAATAPVAGVNGVRECRPGRPVSVLQFHGTADALVGFRGGGLASFVSVETSTRDWARRDGCPGLGADWASDHRAVTFHEGDVTCERYGPCAQGSEVILCRVEGGGHTWPGGRPVPSLGKTTTSISASEEMWRFFQRHPLVR